MRKISDEHYNLIRKHKIVFLTIEASGGGDSGSTNEVTAHDHDGEAITLSDAESSMIFELGSHIIESDYQECNWWDNEGGEVKATALLTPLGYVTNGIINCYEDINDLMDDSDCANTLSALKENLLPLLDQVKTSFELGFCIDEWEHSLLDYDEDSYVHDIETSLSNNGGSLNDDLKHAIAKAIHTAVSDNLESDANNFDLTKNDISEPTFRAELKIKFEPDNIDIDLDAHFSYTSDGNDISIENTSIKGSEGNWRESKTQSLNIDWDTIEQLIYLVPGVSAIDFNQDTALDLLDDALNADEAWRSVIAYGPLPSNYSAHPFEQVITTLDDNLRDIVTNALFNSMLISKIKQQVIEPKTIDCALQMDIEEFNVQQLVSSILETQPLTHEQVDTAIVLGVRKVINNDKIAPLLPHQLVMFLETTLEQRQNLTGSKLYAWLKDDNLNKIMPMLNKYISQAHHDEWFTPDEKGTMLFDRLRASLESIHTIHRKIEECGSKDMYFRFYEKEKLEKQTYGLKGMYETVQKMEENFLRLRNLEMCEDEPSAVKDNNTIYESSI